MLCHVVSKSEGWRSRLCPSLMRDSFPMSILIQAAPPSVYAGNKPTARQAASNFVTWFTVSIAIFTGLAPLTTNTDRVAMLCCVIMITAVEMTGVCRKYGPGASWVSAMRFVCRQRWWYNWRRRVCRVVLEVVGHRALLERKEKERISEKLN